MIDPALAAWIFLAGIAALAVFQFALAAGAPWGSLAMGGRFPGRLPPAMRVAAVVQVVLYGVMAGIVFTRAGLVQPELFEASRVAVWFVVGLMTIALALNIITPSRWERRIWAPVALILLLTSVSVAVGA